MKKITALLGLIAILGALSACNTWSGIKQDAREAGQAAGRGLERAGEKVQDISK